MEAVLNKIREYGIMPLVTLKKAEYARLIGQALTKCCLPVAEVTFRTDQAEDAIRILSEEFPNILVGAGTVLNPEMAERAIRAGASFILAPGLNPEMVQYCQEKKVPVFPGCMTPSELEQAKRLGLKAVKYFPMAQAGGVPTLKSISAPFGDLEFLATGGVNDGNIAEYLSFSKIMSCGGSWMIREQRLLDNDLEGLIQDINKSIASMLKLRFGHIGILGGNEGRKKMCNLFNLNPDESAAGFVGTTIEVLEEQGRGEKGHLAVATCDIVRAIAYYERKGLAIDPESFKKDPQGNLIAAYLKEEISGFAVHLLQSKD